MHHIYLWNLLTDREFQNFLIQMLFRHHEFGKGIGIRNDKNGVACRQSGKHFGSEYLVGGIALAILHGTAIAGGEEEDALLPQHLRKVVVEISRLVGIIEHESTDRFNLAFIEPKTWRLKSTPIPGEKVNAPTSSSVNQRGHSPGANARKVCYIL